jgi:hypothetical protein
VVSRLEQSQGHVPDLAKPRRGSACVSAPATRQCHATEVALMVGEVVTSALRYRRTWTRLVLSAYPGETCGAETAIVVHGPVQLTKAELACPIVLRSRRAGPAE